MPRYRMRIAPHHRRRPPSLHRGPGGRWTLKGSLARQPMVGAGTAMVRRGSPPERANDRIFQLPDSPDDRRGQAPAARPGGDLQRAELIRIDGLGRPRTARATSLRGFSSAGTRSRAWVEVLLDQRRQRRRLRIAVDTNRARDGRLGAVPPPDLEVEGGRIRRPGKVRGVEQPGRSVDARARGRGSCDGGHERADDHRRGAGAAGAEEAGVQAAFSPSCNHQSASARRRRGSDDRATRLAEYAICA